jgi:hypothetical protein
MRLAVMGVVLAASACTSANGSGNGATTAGDEGRAGQRSFDVGAFRSIELAGPHDVVVTVGGAPSVRAEGSAEALERLDIRVDGGDLSIGTRRDSWFSGARRGRVTVYVTAPSLEEASVAGSGNMRIDSVHGEEFEASVAGSGNLDIAALQTRRAEFSIAGSGNITAAGTVEQTEVDIAGSGEARLQALQTRTAEVAIAGSGDINLQASESVGGSIMGSGNVNVRGPARCTVRKMGSGEARCGT